MNELSALARADAAQGNNLIRSLRAADFDLLKPLLITWCGKAGDILYEPGETVSHVYFPCGPSLVSFRVLLDDGRAVETALLGCEGAVGGIVSQGRLPAYARAEVQFSGPFLKIGSAELEDAKMRSLTLRHLFARYADCLMAQVFQATACNAAHSIEQRAAKWLLAAVDRTGGHEVPLTQDQLASMLGVGRSYVSRVIQSLKARGVVETRRGRLLIHRLSELRALSCRCDLLVRRHFDDVLKGVYPAEQGSGRQ
jgi:hypothetical protein